MLVSLLYRKIFLVLSTTDSKTRITGNITSLNSGRLHGIVYIPTAVEDILALGTDKGVFMSTGPSFYSWSRLGTGLPNVAVFDLEYDLSDNILVAGTMGMGA